MKSFEFKMDQMQQYFMNVPEYYNSYFRRYFVRNGMSQYLKKWQFMNYFVDTKTKQKIDLY